MRTSENTVVGEWQGYGRGTVGVGYGREGYGRR